MGPVYAQMADNFHQLRPTGGTGVPTHQAEWVIDGLTLVAKDLLGIRTPQGGLLLVLPHMNKEELDREAADLLLGVLSEVVDLVLPGATPEVWDMRRGKRFRLRGNANRTTLRVALQGYIAKYQREWALIA
ncbi:hypothetical protein Amir_2396 [Actinosynnema mirum DSM 43827]|uniref:Uncharacterized protein n=2 Tax=Actinosynnema mirum TaxID=40567 RepID=C6WJW1_ACTMD|nr:hypothetical protein Amir_2396 [Actinosynnema mirum DSM 43827]